MLISNHILDNAKFVESPNYSERKDEYDIRLIVIHCISLPPKIYGNTYIEDFFCNKLKVKDHEYFAEIYDLKVSSHILIKRSGEIIQFVPFNKKAWHAGLSSFRNDENCNEFSIGIELEGYHTEKYTNYQYKSLIGVSKALFNNYKDLNKDNIVGHSDISPDRKEDPGKDFEWDYYLERL
tara:strand:+ start:1060 stop:1599 length:540 start_codon:yes stop_codon:yes gene_type:complete